MGRVLAGEFEGGRVTILDGYKCLCVKYEGRIVPLDSTRVESYKLKDIYNNPFSTMDKTFVIYWKDGAKSAIALESAYATLLVTGCEVISVAEIPKKVRGAGLVFWIGFFIVFLSVIVIIQELSK